MKTITELIMGLSVLFIIGVAGGLEKGLLSIPSALIAWGVAAVVGAVALAIRKGGRNGTE